MPMSSSTAMTSVSMTLRAVSTSMPRTISMPV
jgi:hypothetical protein